MTDIPATKIKTEFGKVILIYPQIPKTFNSYLLM